jgi:Rps23 Pro-64 3,4-dihydroxylase Tpa1-like proline 4-hydroxylase
MTFVQHDEPFDHWVMDGFQDEDLAKKLSNEFIDFDSKDWYDYNNPLEVKKTLNNWWNFPPTTYRFIEYLNSPEFVQRLEGVTGIKGLHPDPGLHGAGWHIHGRGGKLNVHLDYSIHPKLMLERRLNLIYYLSEDWNPQWGGNLQLWTGNDKKVSHHIKTVDCLFNRAILFDTTQNSWHGFPDKIKCPTGQYRKSIAMYYLIAPQESARPDRKRALYVPSKEQENDPELLKIISDRATLKGK